MEMVGINIYFSCKHLIWDFHDDTMQIKQMQILTLIEFSERF